MTLSDLTAECHRILSLRRDTSILENPTKLSPSESASVNAITHKADSSKKMNTFKHSSKAPSPHHHNQNKQPFKNSCDKPRTPCWKCGQMHFVRGCSYQDHRCKDCQRVGHKEGYCQCVSSNPGKKRRLRQPPVQTKGIYSVKHVAVHHRRKYVSVVINNVPLELQLDCASDITVISEARWNRIGRPTKKPPSQHARTASGQPLDLVAEIDCDVSLRGVQRSGLDFIELFNLWDVPLSMVCHRISSSLPGGRAEFACIVSESVHRFVGLL
ncbi:uncharacterized protein LOC129742863 [Uranotaenia lowii]|uniref:uncharacterized protein LOC129742863 n=1 Tax=Uranotaenia lowii TaxID=190385 RepID=UPI00247B1C2E|nr:uncharacterized protein LOC129742863 [Uranotaenia lowii]